MTPDRGPVRLDPAQLRQYAARLRPGAVVRLHQPVAEKIKRHVLIAATADKSVAFLINTMPSPFVQARENLRIRQLPMRVADHPFMSHDSFIACHDTVSLPGTLELAQLLHRGSAELLGYVSPAVAAQFATTAQGSALISDRVMDLIVAAFGVPPP